MTARVLIVEDEMLVAASLEATLEDHGFACIGIAPDRDAALALAAAGRPDLALVDLNLRDGETGAEIGMRLATEHGATVLFLTANPRRLGPGVPGTLGVLTKPCEEDAVADALAFALRWRQAGKARPPAAVRLFAGRGAAA